LKEGLRGLEKDLGVFVAGGKGRVSRKTPQEIQQAANLASIEPSKLIYASRMAAKVDSTALQNGFQLYHHCFIFTSSNWIVVQQGMNEVTRFARRYHWEGEKVKEFVCEPHSAICCDERREGLNMVARESEKTRKASTLISQEKPPAVIKELKKIQTLKLSPVHEPLVRDIRPTYLEKILYKTSEQKPKNFEELLGIRGVGPKTIRALALVSDLVYKSRPSFRDPATYAFAHGGKDGYPYPVDRQEYDRTIEILRKATKEAKIGREEKLKALRRLESSPFFSVLFLQD
jgi:hypothetical protein